jgi:hypothetical protein
VAGVAGAWRARRGLHADRGRVLRGSCRCSATRCSR